MQESLKSRLVGALLTLMALGLTFGARSLAASTGRYSFKMVLIGGLLFPLGLYVLCLAPPIPVPKEEKMPIILAFVGLFLGECHWFFLTGSWSPFIA